ncbi:peptidyl-prolyl cis-trans isomerase [Flavitalea antarctica]
MKKIWTEPLVHFLLLGLIIFLISGWIQNQKKQSDSTITVDNAAVGRIALLYRMQHNAIPTKDQLDGMVEQYINDEMMYREAKKMGLDEDDEIIKRRLIQKYDFLSRDVKTLGKPGEKELKAYYHENSGWFKDSTRVSFKHIFFSNDKEGEHAAVARASQLLTKIQSGEIPHPQNCGDRFALQQEYNEIDLLEAKQLFGNSVFANTLFRQPAGKWYGPVQSGYGTHLVLITKLRPAALPDFANIKEQVMERYLQEMNRAQNMQFMDELRKRYLVQRDYLNNGK